ncbi:MAG: pyridoxamine 5'-phosphate oxidase family protein [Acidimicrobiales bacterium]|nr:pyridoxamine 5'-phosphate oxidase family protein [Acidimicrobiales bacterium]
MGKVLDALDTNLSDIVTRQPVFFVATAPSGGDGHVNVSPKGGTGSFAVIDPTTVAYLDLTGSGVETIAHLRDNGRITVMFCTFEGGPLIVRLYGRGEAVRPGDSRFDDLRRRFPADVPGVRSIIVVAVDRVATSCGYGVPLMAYEGDRPALRAWAERKGPDGVAAYQADRNAVSIDGLPGLTGSPAG